MTGSGRLRWLADARVALAAFGAVLLAAIPLLLTWGNKWWFWADDWDFLAARTGGNLGDLFRPHYQHWTTLPIIAYRALWWMFGIRSYAPYQLLVILLHLTAVALLRAIMRRAGVRPWPATLLGGVFVFFGAGAENILIAFQIAFVGALVFGLTQLLLADHDGPINRRDWLAIVAGLAGMMCSGVGVTMAIVVAIAMLLRRGWRIALMQAAPLGAAYLVWSVASPKGYDTVDYGTHSPVLIIKFAVIGAGSAFGRLGQVPGLGVVLGLVVLVGIVLAVDREGLHEIRARFAVPLALLVGAGLFLLLTGVVRAGEPAGLKGAFGIGPDRARQSRYVYLVAAMALPTIGIAVDAVARRWRLMTIPIVALVLAGVPGNLHELRIYAAQGRPYREQTRVTILEAPRLPLAHELPQFLSPAHFNGLSLGWLVDSLPSGRIPSPGKLDQTQISTMTLKLMLRTGPQIKPSFKACVPLTETTPRVMRQFQRLTLKTGVAMITYVPPDGAPSRPMPFPAHSTVVATYGPLQLEIKPVRQPASLCG